MPAQLSWPPPWQPQAIKLTLADSTVFHLPRNPTDIADTQGMAAVDRPTLDGVLTYVWTLDPQQIVLQGFTREEGLAPWYAFRQQFAGKLATYEDALSQQRFVVLVYPVSIQASQKPSTYRWQLTLKRAS